jgi:hypothetical protein
MAGVEIISSRAARESIEKRGVARMKREIVTVPQRIETLKGDLEKASDAHTHTGCGGEIRLRLRHRWPSGR